MHRLLLLAVMLTTPALANAMRCGNLLASEGMTRYEVRQRCGDPDDVITRVDVVYRRLGPDRTVAREVQIEEWYYDRPSNSFDRMLLFVDGRLSRIETLEKS
jgi:hypothetical protein